MGFPTNAMIEGEKVSRHFHPHWRTVLRPWIVAVTVVSVLVVGWVILPATIWGRVLLIALVAVAVPPLVIFAVAPLVIWRSNHVVLTTQRILLREGVRNRKQRDIPLARLNEVEINQTLVDRLLRCGTLVIGPPGEHGTIELTDIPRVLTVQRLINGLVRGTGHQPGADVPHLEQQVRQKDSAS